MKRKVFYDRGCIAARIERKMRMRCRVEDQVVERVRNLLENLLEIRGGKKM